MIVLHAFVCDVAIGLVDVTVAVDYDYNYVLWTTDYGLQLLLLLREMASQGTDENARFLNHRSNARNRTVCASPKNEHRKKRKQKKRSKFESDKKSRNPKFPSLGLSELELVFAPAVFVVVRVQQLFSKLLKS